MARSYRDAHSAEEPVAGWRLWVADLVWGLHCAVVAFFVVAWALPWRWALWAAVIGAFLMHLQWRLNDGICVLTKLERLLRGRAPLPKDGEGSFLDELAARWIGPAYAGRFADQAAYVVLWGGAGVAGARLVLA